MNAVWELLALQVPPGELPRQETFEFQCWMVTSGSFQTEDTTHFSFVVDADPRFEKPREAILKVYDQDFEMSSKFSDNAVFGTSDNNNFSVFIENWQTRSYASHMTFSHYPGKGGEGIAYHATGAGFCSNEAADYLLKATGY